MPAMPWRLARGCTRTISSRRSSFDRKPSNHGAVRTPALNSSPAVMPWLRTKDRYLGRSMTTRKGRRRRYRERRSRISCRWSSSARLCALSAVATASSKRPAVANAAARASSAADSTSLPRLCNAASCPRRTASSGDRMSESWWAAKSHVALIKHARLMGSISRAFRYSPRASDGRFAWTRIRARSQRTAWLSGASFSALVYSVRAPSSWPCR